jgi:hypothetical protein
LIRNHNKTALFSCLLYFVCGYCYSKFHDAGKNIRINFLPFGATAQDELWPPEQSASILLYSEADCLVSEQFSFYGVRLLASRPTHKLEDQGILFVWLLPFDLSGMGAPTSSYATAGIALRVSGALKPHHHDKVETPSVGIHMNCIILSHQPRSSDVCFETGIT